MVFKPLIVISLLIFVPTSRSLSRSVDTLVQVISIDTTKRGYVVLDQDTLFVIAVGGRSFGADHRATIISEQIRRAADDWTLSADSMRLYDEGVATDLTLQGRFIMSVFDADARMEGAERSSLAETRAETIRQAIIRYREERDSRSIFQGLLFSILASVVLVFFLRILRRIFTWIDRFVESHVRGIRLRSSEVVRAEWLKAALGILTRLVRWTMVILIVYAYLTFVLSRFVWTREIASQVIDFTLEPIRVFGTAVTEYLPNLFFLLVIALITRYLIRFLKMLSNEIAGGAIAIPGFYRDWAFPTYNIVRVLIVAFAVVVAFPYIPGSNSPAFQGMSIFLGVLFSLGSTSAVANVVAGVILMYMRSFKVGEVVKINETIGVVISQGALVTRIRTPKNVEVSIPNSTVLTTHVTNFSAEAVEGKLILHTSVTIGYDTPWRQVHALLTLAAERTVDILKEPAPFVLQTSLNDFYVTYELNVHTRSPEIMPAIFSDLHMNIQDAFNEYGVQIMSPNYIADRAAPTIVPKDRWFAKPAKVEGGPGKKE